MHQQPSRGDFGQRAGEEILAGEQANDARGASHKDLANRCRKLASGTETISESDCAAGDKPLSKRFRILA